MKISYCTPITLITPIYKVRYTERYVNNHTLHYYEISPVATYIMKGIMIQCCTNSGTRNHDTMMYKLTIQTLQSSRQPHCSNQVPTHEASTI